MKRMETNAVRNYNSENEIEERKKKKKAPRQATSMAPESELRKYSGPISLSRRGGNGVRPGRRRGFLT
jgi:hypothetical protein